ncbi:LNR domain protein [Pelomyxa schiedti]|nr:LNR domain protein [Pelomyxa schiedti]
MRQGPSRWFRFSTTTVVVACVIIIIMGDNMNMMAVHGVGWCPSSCEVDGLIGNGVCDMICYSTDCEYDGGDCDDLCNPGCWDSEIGNGECDPYCFAVSCNWDDGDCKGGVCGTWNCLSENWGDGYCDLRCANDACYLDDWDCYGINCAPSCRAGMVGDGYCEWECMYGSCEYDGGDCDEYCYEECYNSDVHDDFCDPQCYNDNCDYDGGDCDIEAKDYCLFPLCKSAWVGDDVCQTNCYNSACEWDGGDCNSTYCGELLCELDSIGDDVCNYECNTEDCDYDDGDCSFVNAYMEGLYTDTECENYALYLAFTACPTSETCCHGFSDTLTCTPDIENVGQACITYPAIQTMVWQEMWKYISYNEWANPNCLGAPYFSEYYASDCRTTQNNLWGYMEVAEYDLLVNWVCSDMFCNFCYVSDVIEISTSCITDGYKSWAWDSARSLPPLRLLTVIMGLLVMLLL